MKAPLPLFFVLLTLCLAYGAYDLTTTSSSTHIASTVSVKAAAPRELKKDTLIKLEEAKRLTTNNHTVGRIEKAIEHISRSLDSRLWVDDFHLTKCGYKVFYEEKQAVHYLIKILRDKKETTVVKEVVQAVIGRLLQADKLLAEMAIREAKAMGSTDPRVIHEIKEADEEFSEALSDIGKGRFEHAIEEFKEAWMHAQHAMKKKTQANRAILTVWL
jgi:hypothetical protein